MAKTINVMKTIDEETGEICYERTWHSYNGWKGDAFKFRPKSKCIKLFPDCMPPISPNSVRVWWMLVYMMNEDNLLIKVVKRTDKYSADTIIPFTYTQFKKEIKSGISDYNFVTAWKELVEKSCIKRIRFQNKWVWAINPVYAMATEYLPIWLYRHFKDDIDKYISKFTVGRINNLIVNSSIEERNLGDGEKI